MKIKIIIIIFVVVLLISGGLLTIKYNDSKPVISVEHKENEVVDSNNDQVIEDKKEIIEEETKEVVENKETTKKEEIKKSENKKVETTTQQKQEVKQITKTEIPKEQTTTQQNQETTKPVETTKPKEQPIWEVLGMTEYQYYNEPMYKWEKVDFSVSKYGSEQAAINACLEYGDKYEPYLNGEVAYHCTTVNTASGKYLGEWFHTEKLID